MKRFFIWFGKKVIKFKFVRISADILLEVYYEVFDAVSNNLRNLTTIMRIGLPYLMWYIGAYLYEERGYFAVGSEVFIPLFIFIFTYYVRQYANRIGKGERIPIPEKRFTELGEEDGEYTVEINRMEEMIIYMSNLEDWLQRKGLLK